MNIIEYFNFKNKPLKKDEKTKITNKVDEFLHLLENSANNVDKNNSILNEDNIHTKLKFRKLCLDIITKGIGKIIYTTIQDTFIYALFVDIGQCFNFEENTPTVLQALTDLGRNNKVFQCCKNH